MSYVRKIISSDEKLISISTLHWVYVLEGVLWFLGLFLLGVKLDQMLWQHFGSTAQGFDFDFFFIHFDERNTPMKWLFGAAGFAIFWPLMLKYVSTEIGLTDKRIIHKKGLILIEVQQVDLEDIRAENVQHGWFGWLLRYGKLHFDCRFVDDVYLPAINKPYRLIKAAHKARMRHPEIDYGQKEFEMEVDDIEMRRRAAYRARQKMQHMKKALPLTFKRSS